MGRLEDTFKTEKIKPLEKRKGIHFPAFLETKKLIITGPPGCGKTTILNAIGGWPEEGYLDISSKEWWKSPILQQRPRELHFGLPFVGFEKAVPVYDAHTLDDSSYLEIDFFRIPLPPPKTHPLSTDFRGRFVIEFILLPAEKTYELRKKRSKSGTHHVDEGLTLSKVQEELHFFKQLALFFHQNGMTVYIRDDLNGKPKKIREPLLGQLDESDKHGEALFHHLDQIRLRERLLNRSWSIRGNKNLIDLFVELIPKALKVERCSIFINDPKTGKVWLQSGTGVDEKQIELEMDESLVGQVITTGQYIIKEDMHLLDGPHKEIDAQTGFVTRNELCVPIMSLSDQKTTGAILILNKKGGKSFHEADRLLLEKVASHLQSAIESIFLRQELMDFSELLTNRARFSEWAKYLIWALIGLTIAQGIFITYLLEQRF
ncbi:MAG: GAF domain-containing protein [Gammaproteobacteria bacterium]|nr:GAF domain-containing protein [Gammaproteobacteria bacterium]